MTLVPVMGVLLDESVMLDGPESDVKAIPWLLVAMLITLWLSTQVQGHLPSPQTINFILVACSELSHCVFDKTDT